MSRLIDADMLKTELLECDFLTEYEKFIHEEDFIKFVNVQPTIDAVPVVRCKDCKYYVNYCGEKCCDIFLDGKEEPYQTKPTDFCSFGENGGGAKCGKMNQRGK